LHIERSPCVLRGAGSPLDFEKLVFDENQK